jgi:hypothetical protein
MYGFSLFAYYQLKDSYPPGFCDSTWNCLITSMDMSFKYDGSMGGYFQSHWDSDEVPGHEHQISYLLIRFFFDNFYHILLMVIMINIVSGIIIDTFGSLREELQRYKHDLDNFCFICGFDIEAIEKNSKNNLGFKNHIKVQKIYKRLILLKSFFIFGLLKIIERSLFVELSVLYCLLEGVR